MQQQGRKVLPSMVSVAESLHGSHTEGGEDAGDDSEYSEEDEGEGDEEELSELDEDDDTEEESHPTEKQPQSQQQRQGRTHPASFGSDRPSQPTQPTPQATLNGH